MPASIICLFSAIIVYALAGSPTPDNPGWPEIVIGLLLVLAAGAGGLKSLSLSEGQESIFLRALHILFFVGLVVPVVTGILRGNDVMLMGRDILAFLFLCLPLFMVSAFARDEKARQWLAFLLVFAGLAFAVRTLIPAFNIWIAQGELLYLSNSPLVLFSAIFAAACFWKKVEVLKWKNFAEAALLLGMVFILLAAMLLDVQRATIAAVVISFAVLWIETLFRSPKRIIIPTIVLLVAGYFGAPWVIEAGEAIYRKTSAVGMNMRLQEVEAVIAALSSDPLGFFVGTGWGGAFASPTVGMIEVNYTHSLLSTMFLKGGMVMFCLTAIVFFAALYEVFLIFQRDRSRGLSVFWPLLIPVLLYASHKSLDFGLLLLLIGVWSVRAGRLHKPA